MNDYNYLKLKVDKAFKEGKWTKLEGFLLDLEFMLLQIKESRVYSWYSFENELENYQNQGFQNKSRFYLNVICFCQPQLYS